MQGLVSRVLKDGFGNSNQQISTQQNNIKNNGSSFDETYHKNLIKSYLSADITLDDILEQV